MAAYDDSLANWWHRQAADPAHRRAYRHIAEYLRASFTRPPGVILDFACGEGQLLRRLGGIFPSARLIGLDGSSLMLDLARSRLQRPGRASWTPVLLIRTPLPSFALRIGPADLVLFTFPNMVPSRKDEDTLLIARHLGRQDHLVARRLADWRDDEEPDDQGAEEVASILLKNRLVSLNLRRLLKRRGICLRAEYAGCKRDELLPSELARAEFEEGTLEHQIDGVGPQPWFRVLASSFIPSAVIEDVYQQSGQCTRGMGGYSLTLLRAI